MSAGDASALPDLTGSVDDRLALLAELERAHAALPPEWLLRQLRSALAGWAGDETELDITRENHDDY
ncbi:hypothetical protein AB0870_15010 [Microbacterium proteolyticum]|uniref:hypothetical protein n=1 Tax=Microbacterium proteolyticum TaxID=1572644 RepID=UPI0024168C3D|nr:hypothetical protein [Microbacterium proteolyticum]